MIISPFLLYLIIVYLCGSGDNYVDDEYPGYGI